MSEQRSTCRVACVRSLASFALVAFVVAVCPALAAPSELWKINADGTGLARFADTPGYTCGSPEWSPDGKFVAYDTWRLDQKLEDSQIVVIRADGTHPRNLGIGAMPSWSPDGSQLVFHVYGVNPNDGSRSADDHIDVMNADGTGREKILNHWGSPRWSRTGNRIVSISDNNLALFDLATGKEHIILPRPFSMYWGQCVSPNGLRLCFTGYEIGLYLATLDETTMRATVRTLVASGKCNFPSFAPDNKRVVFGYYPKGARANQLYVMDVDADTEPHILPSQDPNFASWGPNWSPDGKTIIFCGRPVTTTKKPIAAESTDLQN